MTAVNDIMACFSGEVSQRPLYLADLTLWYRWHQARGSLPAGWQSYSLAQLAEALGSPAWWVVRPWRQETPGVAVTTQEEGDQRLITYHTSAGRLTERWALGPDGDWWQIEYPVKSLDDLPAARQLIEARHYQPDTTALAEWQAQLGVSGLLAIELPRRPYSEVLHTLLGWGEGLMLLYGEGAQPIQDMLDVLEEKLHALEQELVGLPVDLVFAPDNLDGQYISPAVFRQHLAASYQRSVDLLHRHAKRLIVHGGGPLQHLLAPLAAAGVDAVEGVSGPPQGDTPLPKAREKAGPHLTLWGGIPQDVLLPPTTQAEFGEAVRQAAQQAKACGRVVLGVADKVPVEADLERLKAVPDLIRQAW